MTFLLSFQLISIARFQHFISLFNKRRCCLTPNNEFRAKISKLSPNRLRTVKMNFYKCPCFLPLTKHLEKLSDIYHWPTILNIMWYWPTCMRLNLIIWNEIEHNSLQFYPSFSPVGFRHVFIATSDIYTRMLVSLTKCKATMFLLYKPYATNVLHFLQWNRFFAFFSDEHIKWPNICQRLISDFFLVVWLPYFKWYITNTETSVTNLPSFL